MIRIIPSRGRAHPRLYCDQCGQPIADAITACYAWREGDEAAEVVTLHDGCLPHGVAGRSLHARRSRRHARRK